MYRTMVLGMVTMVTMVMWPIIAIMEWHHRAWHTDHTGGTDGADGADGTVDYFITAVEVNRVNDPEEIMAQVRNMQMCMDPMDLPPVNLLQAEAWLWEDFRDDLQRKAGASDEDLIPLQEKVIMVIMEHHGGDEDHDDGPDGPSLNNTTDNTILNSQNSGTTQNTTKEENAQLWFPATMGFMFHIQRSYRHVYLQWRVRMCLMAYDSADFKVLLGKGDHLCFDDFQD